MTIKAKANQFNYSLGGGQSTSGFQLPNSYLNMGGYGFGSPATDVAPYTGGGLDPMKAQLAALKQPNSFGFGGIGGQPNNPVGDNSTPFLSNAKQQGWGNMALDAASSLAQLFMGMKQYGLAKDTLAENKKQFETNFAAQKGLTNASLEDRQRARVASNAGAYQSVGSYMDQNGVK